MKRVTIAGVAGLLLSGVVQAFRPAVTAGLKVRTTTVTKDQVDRWMTELSNWGSWGKTDQIGTLNLVTADQRRR